MLVGLVVNAALISVALGGALGALLRFYLVQRMGGSAEVLNEFMTGVVVSNVVGCFLMGILVGWMMYRQSRIPDGGDWGRSAVFLFLGTGFLGGLTSFSSFAFDSVELFYQDAYMKMAIYVVVSVVSSLAAIFVGYWMTRKLAMRG